MAIPLSIAPTARDLTFNFNDSCNCCCFGRPKEPHDDTHVYVNSRGQVVAFDPRKAEDERESMKRTISNLQSIIGNMASESHEEKEQVIRDIERKVTPLSPKDPTPVTFVMVKQMISIANAFKTAHSESSPLSNSSQGSF